MSGYGQSWMHSTGLSCSLGDDGCDIQSRVSQCMTSQRKVSAVLFSRTNCGGGILLDVEKYGFEGEYVGSTEFDGKLIEGNALNISGSYIDDTSSDLYAGAWCREECPYRSSRAALFTAKNAQLFRLNDIVGNGSCQPVPDVGLSYPGL